MSLISNIVLSGKSPENSVLLNIIRRADEQVIRVTCTEKTIDAGDPKMWTRSACHVSNPAIDFKYVILLFLKINFHTSAGGGDGKGAAVHSETSRSGAQPQPHSVTTGYSTLIHWHTRTGWMAAWPPPPTW